MVELPGVPLARRPLNFFWIADCSGSMSQDGKIEALNRGIREAVPEMKRVAGENPHAQLVVRAVKFSHGAEWHVPQPTPVEAFAWSDLIADSLSRPTVDVVFMVDTSGSMSDEIDAVKSSCTEFADQIIQQGANVRLGLVGFDIGGHMGSRRSSMSQTSLGDEVRSTAQPYRVHDLSRYTIGIWPLTQPDEFKRNVQSLSLGLFGGGGCYLADSDTVDIFPHVVSTFSGDEANQRVLVIISDEIGGAEGVQAIVSQLNRANIKAHVMGVAGHSHAHERIAELTEGKFWDISASGGAQDFSGLLDLVAETIAREVSQRLADGSVSSGTDMGAALRLVGEAIAMDQMPTRALPPVLVLLSDGQPTDDFESGLAALMGERWAKKAVRLAIAIGRDADLHTLQRFINHPEIHPLQANNPTDLIAYIRWASTAVVQGVTTPLNAHRDDQPGEGNAPVAVPVPAPAPTRVIRDQRAEQVW